MTFIFYERKSAKIDKLVPLVLPFIKVLSVMDFYICLVALSKVLLIEDLNFARLHDFCLTA